MSPITVLECQTVFLFGLGLQVSPVQALFIEDDIDVQDHIQSGS